MEDDRLEAVALAIMIVIAVIGLVRPLMIGVSDADPGRQRPPGREWAGAIPVGHTPAVGIE